MRWYHHLLAIGWALASIASSPSGGYFFARLAGALALSYAIIWFAVQLWPSGGDGEEQPPTEPDPAE